MSRARVSALGLSPDPHLNRAMLLRFFIFTLICWEGLIWGEGVRDANFLIRDFSIGNIDRLVSFPESRLQVTYINSNMPVINCVNAISNSSIMKDLDSLYQLRNKFIIIGLTGRLGSGCSTVASLLTKENFSDCNFPAPSNENTNEDRKYKIVYKFLKDNWKQYLLIRPSDLITAMLLRHPINDIREFLLKVYADHEKEVDTVIKEISDQFSNLQYVSELFNDEYTFNINKSDDIFHLFFESDLIFELTKKMKESFNKLRITNNSSPFQHFGNNIRKTGSPLNDKNFDPSNCYRLADLINQLVKIARNKRNKEVRIVIDSIRNSLEARYFKERFSAFYFFAVNTEDEARRSRLIDNYNAREIEALDQEYTNLETEERFYKQDIQTCIQVSDIYLHNPNKSNSDGEKFRTLKKQLVRYLALILQPGIITPTPEERCMQIAYTAKYNSGCISRQVGAVVADQSFSLKSIGWNNTAEGQTPCLLRSVDELLGNSDLEAYSHYEKEEPYKALIKQTFTLDEVTKKRLKGRNLSFCFKDSQNCIDGNKNQVHTRSLHAEENAMLQIAKYGGEGLKSGLLFTTASPCELCSKKAYQLGIKRIFYIDPYPGISEKQILKSGVPKHQPETQLFAGAVGRAYHHLFEPFMAYKDELKTLLAFDYEIARIKVVKATNGETKESEIAKLRKQQQQIQKKIDDLTDVAQASLQLSKE